jgi:hypothetical protein
MVRNLVHALRMSCLRLLHYRPLPRDGSGPRSPLPLRLWAAWRDAELPHLANERMVLLCRLLGEGRSEKRPSRSGVIAIPRGSRSIANSA